MDTYFIWFTIWKMKFKTTQKYSISIIRLTKIQKIDSVGQPVKKQKLLCTAGGSDKGDYTCGGEFGNSKNIICPGSENSSLKDTSTNTKEKNKNKAIYYSIIHNSKRLETKCSSLGERLNELWNIYISEYYTALKKNSEDLSDLIWRDLYNIVSNKKNKIQKEHLLCKKKWECACVISTHTRIHTHTHTKMLTSVKINTGRINQKWMKMVTYSKKVKNGWKRVGLNQDFQFTNVYNFDFK